MIVELPTSGGFPSEKMLPLLPKLLLRIAPEKQAQIEQALAHVTLAITDSAEWDCKAAKNWSLIIISRKTVEVVWALSYAYWTFYQTFSANHAPQGQVLNLAADAGLTAPRQLLAWAVDNLTHHAVTELPPGLPSPADAVEEGSDLHAVLEITLVALAFFLHHELAHVKFANRDFTGVTLDEERACDKEALAVVLDVADKAQQNKRALGTATGLLLLNAVGFGNGFFDGVEHPFAYDRLLSLAEWIDKENDLVWGWVVALLALHMTNAGIAQPTQEFENFYDCAHHYQQLLSARETR